MAQPSLWDRVLMFGLFPLFATRWLVAFVFHGNRTLHWRQRLALTFLQAQRATFPTRLIRWRLRQVSTGEAILGYCKKHNIPHKPITLGASTTVTTSSAVEGTVPAPTLHILTAAADSQHETDPTLVYFHGGGFVNPLREVAHMPFIMRCAEASRAKQVVVLEYALAPEHPYPAQLVQCVATLRYLLNEMALRPEDIVLAGDSAGGQLVGALLAHLVKLSPYADPVTVEGAFRAALLVSPFVRLQTDSSSYESNNGRDFLSAPQVEGFTAAWEGRKDEIWSNLYGVEASGEVWCKVFEPGSQGLVRKAMVTVGTAEVFLDCCRAFAKEHVKAETVAFTRDTDCQVFEGKDRVLVECDGEAHVQVGMDFGMGYDKGAMMRSIMAWLAHV